MVHRCSVLFPFLSLFLMLTGCAPNLQGVQPEDLSRYSQDPHSYLVEDTADTIVLSPEQVEAVAAHYRQQFFRPWHSHGPLPETSSAFWAVAWIKEKEVYDINLQPLVSARREGLIYQVDQGHYPSMARCAISVTNTNLRALPTMAPLFKDPRQAGEGFPFDMLQHSSVPVNTPLLITHQSRDGEWLFAETPAYYGWLPARDIARVDESLMRRFEELPLVACVLDSNLMVPNNSERQLQCQVGTLFPVLRTDQSQRTVLVVGANVMGQGQILNAKIAREAAVPFPMKPTPRNMADLAATMIGQPYDWGGRYRWRDCSATVRDLFAPFGIWLPRNSSQQTTVGRQVDLTQSKENMEELISRQAEPFFGLINLPGHVMLYLGARQGQPVALHTIWGLATHSFGGNEGRWIIGRTVITSLHPGQEQAGLLFSVRDLASRVHSLSFPLENN